MTGDPYIRFLTEQRAKFTAKMHHYAHAPNAEAMDLYATMHMMYSGLETGIAIALSVYTPNVEVNNEVVPS